MLEKQTAQPQHARPVWGGHLEALNVLLQYGADLSVVSNGLSLEKIARVEGHSKIVDRLNELSAPAPAPFSAAFQHARSQAGIDVPHAKRSPSACTADIASTLKVRNF